MKIELQFLQDPYEPYEHENLAFSFWKRDIKTDTDKKKIVSMIHHLYHMCCVESGMDVKDLDEILANTTYAKVGFTIGINLESSNYSLYTYNANKKN